MRKLERVGEHEWRFLWPRAFWDAYEAIDEAVELHNAGKGTAGERGLRDVLERVPEHLDARWQLAGFLYRRGQVAEAAELWREALKLGRTAFPSRAFQLGRDQLPWGWLENRPFLRCLASWMHMREEAGALEEALGAARELLALNPNDNQGVRCVAMTWLLRSGGNEEAAKLAEGYPEDGLPETTYSRALALFRLGRFDEADDALRDALAGLPAVGTELLRTRHRAPRRRHPGYTTIGGTDQAYDYWQSDGAVWAATPGAMEWLRRVSDTGRGARQDEPPETGR